MENLGTAVSTNSIFVAPGISSISQQLSLKDLDRKHSVANVAIPKLDLRKLVSVDSIPRSCYQTEFMEQIDQCSKSWRDAAIKDQRT